MTDKLYYSTDFSALGKGGHKGWCLHLVCTAGSGGFIYNGVLYHLLKNDVVISPHPELITEATAGAGLKVEYIMGKMSFINAQMPAQHYGIRGGINLFGDPLLHATRGECRRILQDLRNLRDRIEDETHPYYEEELGAGILSMVYDLFVPHLRERGEVDPSDRSANLVNRLNALLETGTARTHREPKWYAEKLHVSAKYLSETVKRMTGDNVTYLINRYALISLTAYLKDDTLTFTQIADTMGFSSLSYFSRYTLKLTGLSPSEYRMKSL